MNNSLFPLLPAVSPLNVENIDLNQLSDVLDICSLNSELLVIFDHPQVPYTSSKDILKKRVGVV